MMGQRPLVGVGMAALMLIPFACGKKAESSPSEAEADSTWAKSQETKVREMQDVVDVVDLDAHPSARYFFGEALGDLGELLEIAAEVVLIKSDGGPPMEGMISGAGTGSKDSLDVFGARSAGSEIHRPVELDWIEVSVEATVSNLPKDSVGVRVIGKHPCNRRLRPIDLVDVGVANPSVGPVTRTLKLPGAKYCFRGFDPQSDVAVTDEAQVTVKAGTVTFGLVYLGASK